MDDGRFFKPPPPRRSWPAVRDRLEYLSDPIRQKEQTENGHKLLLAFAEYLFHKKQTLTDREGWYADADELLKSLELDGFRLSEGHIISTTATSSEKEIQFLSKKQTQGQNSKDLTKVWIIPGRDERLRNGLFQFLRCIGLQPLEFLEARKLTRQPTPYIGEILEAAFEHAQAVVVLLTPDDEGRLRPVFQSAKDSDDDKRLTSQARLNVIFEAVMAFVTHPKQTILVQIGEVRPFSDVYGRHIVHLDNSTHTRQELASRLEDAGCPINLSGTDWHTIGDLAPPPPIGTAEDRKSTRLNSSHQIISYAVFCLKKKTTSGQGAETNSPVVVAALRVRAYVSKPRPNRELRSDRPLPSQEPASDYSPAALRVGVVR